VRIVTLEDQLAAAYREIQALRAARDVAKAKGVSARERIFLVFWRVLVDRRRHQRLDNPQSRAVVRGPIDSGLVLIYGLQGLQFLWVEVDKRHGC
jgi:hypothetical protein